MRFFHVKKRETAKYTSLTFKPFCQTEKNWQRKKRLFYIRVCIYNCTTVMTKKSFEHWKHKSCQISAEKRELQIARFVSLIKNYNATNSFWMLPLWYCVNTKYDWFIIVKLCFNCYQYESNHINLSCCLCITLIFFNIWFYHFK